jgi:hypothetical protein
MMDIEATAKKYASELMDRLTEKRYAHMSDLVDAFTRALNEAQPKPPYWGTVACAEASALASGARRDLSSYAEQNQMKNFVTPKGPPKVSTEAIAEFERQYSILAATVRSAINSEDDGA